MTSLQRARAANLLLLLGGTASIAAAWGFQLIGGYLPCKLCLEQRVPYYVGLPLGVLALLALLTRRTGIATVLLLLVAAVFAYGAGLGAYQAGAEWGFWMGPSDCGGGGATPRSAANMLQALQNTRVVSCTEASWRMFGLSFAGWNMVASAAVAVLALFAGYQARKG
ncbi:disulfide bond formation protein B [Pannonibacter sp. Q-1]|uniref:Dihydroneopterin aldolase n=1 Tax=Pannonibacter phragmitetus TaxID=121719 RepID=A0A0L0ITK8_9HYPH|nr:disulfide bond formation protein B [Pannonibacter phragmitetus]ALV27045.1 dihydroneopterin aldolase [Pannonibacter phragmitetus]KND16425.1 dihydroneopterin aldolase [Pannonibacter phragmitetus]